MSEDSTLELGEVEGEVSDSEVIKGFRAREKALKAENAELKARPSVEEIEASVRASVARESAIGNELVAAGLPTSIAPLVGDKLGEAEVTPEGVKEALVGLGFATEQTPAEGAPAELTEVVSLGAQVQAAASVADVADLEAKIEAAQSPEEVQAIILAAQKAGL